MSIPVRTAPDGAAPLADTLDLELPLSILPGKNPPGWLRVTHREAERWVRETGRDKTGVWPVTLLRPGRAGVQ